MHRASHQNPRDQPGQGAAWCLVGVDVRAQLDDIGGVEASVPVYPYRAALGQGTDEIDARGGAVIRGLVEIGEAQHTQQKQCHFNLSDWLQRWPSFNRS